MSTRGVRALCPRRLPSEETNAGPRGSLASEHERRQTRPLIVEQKRDLTDDLTGEFVRQKGHGCLLPCQTGGILATPHGHVDRAKRITLCAVPALSERAGFKENL